MEPTGITLAVIVKNEARLLRDLLAYHAPLYTEAVVVDTGSGDGSRQVARDAGATVLDFNWCDDFSAARNVGLAAAREPWILVLDCDERIAVRDFSRVTRLATESGDQCHAFPQWNYTTDKRTPAWEPTPAAYRSSAAGADGYVPAWSLRLFPNHPDLRYAGCVHEQIVPLGRGQTFTHHQADIPVHHYGHLPGFTAFKNRKRHYFNLLKKKVELNPQDSAALTDLACHLYDMDEGPLSRQLLESTVRRFPAGPEVHRARLLLGRILEREGDFAPARHQFDAALAQRPDWRPCWVEAARAAFEQGDRERTRLLVREGRRLFPRDARLEGLETKVFGPSGR